VITIRTVLCPVDFSAATARQVDLAADVCRTFGARLVLHHNVATVAVGAGVGWMWAADHHESEEAVRRQLQALLARVPAVVQAEAQISHGGALQSVLAVSSAIDADLVVLSTHGTASDGHESVTAHVLERTNRAVLALHDTGVDGRSPRFSSPGLRQVILVPTDLTDGSRAAVEFAFDLARAMPVELHLLHLVSHGDVHGPVAEHARERLRAVIPADLAGCTVLHVDGGDAAQGIARLATELSASCIVMGEHSRSPMRRWFARDTSRGVLHRAACPIWYVPGSAAA
jgi:nucleotide-binding universal stress UspA family protein